MAKYSGKIGFAKSERVNGVWEDTIIEKKAYGEVLQNHRRWDTTENVNDDLQISNRISIVANKFITENLGAMKYASYMGQLWKIKSADVEYPRIILLLGGVYNGPQATTAR